MFKPKIFVSKLTGKIYFHEFTNSLRSFGVGRNLDLDRVPLTEARLEVLRTPQAAKLAVDHDRQTRAERFTLFHAEKRKQAPYGKPFESLQS